MLAIDQENLEIQEGLVKDALLKAGKRDWEEQIDQAIKELEVIFPEINSIPSETAEVLATYYCLYFIFKYMAMDTEDIFFQKQQEYNKKFNELLNKIKAKGIDIDGDGENDIDIMIDMER